MMAGMTSIAKDFLQDYVLDSNEALEFKLVRRVEDLEDEAATFKPEMSHQVFGDTEQIFGYKGLRLKLYYTAGRLTTYFGVEYGDKVVPDKMEGLQPDELLKPVAEKIPPGFLTNLDDFSSSLNKEAVFRPYGEMKHRFEVFLETGEEKVFEVYYCDAATCPGFLEYYERLQPFIMWYIDAASYIDTDDLKWRFFLVYEKYNINGKDDQYAVAGFTTVYEYYAYPANIRPRISQMLILPPFQRIGLGVEMLDTIYRHYVAHPQVLDITVEDPSDDFMRLRDYVDCKNCLKLKSFLPGKLLSGYTTDMMDEASKAYKLSKNQIRRVYEILRLHFTDRSNEEEYKQYRLAVKNRLYLQYRKEDVERKKLERLLRPEELAASLAITPPDKRRENLERQYHELEEYYCRILDRLSDL